MPRLVSVTVAPGYEHAAAQVAGRWFTKRSPVVGQAEDLGREVLASPILLVVDLSPAPAIPEPESMSTDIPAPEEHKPARRKGVRK